MTAPVTTDSVRSVHIERRLDAPPYRVYRAWSSPDALTTWFPDEVEGSLALGTRSMLVFPARRVAWDVLVAEPDRHFRFSWPWAERDGLVTTVDVILAPRGYGTVLTLDDGPFDLALPGTADAYAECLIGWGEALANLRAVIDFSVDLRRYRSG